MDESVFIYTQLASHAVLRFVVLHYDLPEPVHCKFYVRGLHDNYLIESEHQKFILRIYRNQWRSEEAIGFELELLSFLGDQATLVAYPLRTKNGAFSFSIDCPEGKRFAALFPYADGHAPGNELSINVSVLLGKSIANIHRLSDGFTSNYTRPLLELPHLLDESIIAIQPFVHAEYQAYLKALQNKLYQAIPVINQTPGKYGICIGDVNPTNFHVNETQQITVFDFDQCGYGYRAFEIGKFISAIHPLKAKHELTKAFIDGYQQVRQLSQEEITAIPYFEMVAVIWVMAINANNTEYLGHKWYENAYWDRKLSILRELDSQIFTGN